MTAKTKKSTGSSPDTSGPPRRPTSSCRRSRRLSNGSAFRNGTVRPAGWPAQYRATWVPFYERFIVTDSMDSADMYGYTDLAIGQFGDKETISEGSRRIVVKEWRRRYRYESQGKWEGLFDFGLIGPGEVEAWADAVWGADWDPNYAW